MSINIFKFRVIKPKDLIGIQQFYKENFYKHEPVFRSNPDLVPGRRDQEDMAECVNQGTSVLCYRQTKEGGEEIIGGLLSMPKRRCYERQLFQAAEQEGHSKYGHYLRMLALLHEKADICRRYNVDELFFTLMVSIDPKWRCQNIAKRLLDESISLATDMGFKVLTGDCTSNYSDRICRNSLKMEKVASLKYKDFVDAKGKPYFTVPPPHQGVNTYAVPLPWPIKAFRGYKC